MGFEEDLINEVRSNEILYNSKMKEYRNIDIKRKIWDEISLRLNSSEEECRAKWKNLRDTFKRVKRLENNSANNGHKEHKNSKWKFYKNLLFLDGYSKKRSATNSASKNTNTNTNANTNTNTNINPNTNPNTNMTQYIKEENQMPRTIMFEYDNTGAYATTATDMQGNPKMTAQFYPNGQQEKPKVENVECTNTIFKSLVHTATRSIENINDNHKSATRKLFEMLAAKIDNAQLSHVELNDLEIGVTTLVYNAILNHRHY